MLVNNPSPITGGDKLWLSLGTSDPIASDVNMVILARLCTVTSGKVVMLPGHATQRHDIKGVVAASTSNAAYATSLATAITAIQAFGQAYVNAQA